MLILKDPQTTSMQWKQVEMLTTQTLTTVENQGIHIGTKLQKSITELLEQWYGNKNQTKHTNQQEILNLCVAIQSLDPIMKASLRVRNMLRISLFQFRLEQVKADFLALPITQGSEKNISINLSLLNTGQEAKIGGIGVRTYATKLILIYPHLFSNDEHIAFNKDRSKNNYINSKKYILLIFERILEQINTVRIIKSNG